MASQASRRCWAAGLHCSPPFLTSGHYSSQQPVATALLPPAQLSLQGGRRGLVLGTKPANPQQYCSDGAKDLGCWGTCMEHVSVSSLLMFLWVGEGHGAQPAPLNQCFLLCK